MIRRPGPTPLGIDFGTSNSAVSFVGADGVARLLPLEGDATTIPTAVFFNAEDRSVHYGRDAASFSVDDTARGPWLFLPAFLVYFERIGLDSCYDGMMMAERISSRTTS